MKELNQFLVQGTVGFVETRESKSGAEYTIVTVYCANDYKDKDGTWVNQSDRFAIFFFGASASYASSLSKGDKVIIQSRLGVRQDGDSSTINLNGESIWKIGGKATEKENPQSSKKRPVQSSPQKGRGKPVAKKYSRHDEDDDDDDDLTGMFDDDDDDAPF